MYKYLDKIDKNLKDLVSLQSPKKAECIIYANNYIMLQKQLEKINLAFTPLPFIKAFAVNLDGKDVYKLAKASIVNFILKESKVFTQVNVSKEILNVESFYENNNYGAGATVAIIDTGISPHVDFCLVNNRIIKFVDLVNNQEEPYDDNGHGTFVASILAGSGVGSGKKFSGVAPKCNIISIKALEKNGETSASNILKGMQWVFDNRKKYNISVVCMSFGSTPIGRNDPLLIGAEVLWNSGIVVVAAAGNSGPERETIKSPGISPKIITVGGLNDNRVNDNFDAKNFEVANFSSRGPAGYFFKPDCIAPAVDITGASNKGGYCKMSGTSVATPMVAGVAALFVAQNPQISPDQVKVKLLNTCKKITNDRNQEGSGWININFKNLIY